MARTARKTRKGRGRLSKLDRLPDVAQPDLIWLNQQLRANKRDQIELLDLFNARLAVHGIEPISSSSFSRYSVRKATQFHELDETHRLSMDLAEMLGTDSADKMTIALGELIKVSSFKLVEGGGLEPMDIMSLARAIKDVVGAQKQSADYRRVLEEEQRRKLAETLNRVEEAASKGPMDAASVLAMIRKAYGWTE